MTFSQSVSRTLGSGRLVPRKKGSPRAHMTLRSENAPFCSRRTLGNSFASPSRVFRCHLKPNLVNTARSTSRHWFEEFSFRYLITLRADNYKTTFAAAETVNVTFLSKCTEAKSNDRTGQKSADATVTSNPLKRLMDISMESG